MAAQPEPWKSLRAKIEQLEKAVKRLQAASPFSGTGLSVPEDGTTQVDGSLHVLGQETIDGQLTVGSGDARSGNYVSGSTGWRLRSDGTIEMNDALIRGGIIGNDALANPVLTTVHHAEADSFSLATGANVAKATITVTVPTGYTKAQVTAYAMLNALNTAASEDQFYCVAWIQSDTSRGWAASAYLGAGKFGSLNNTATAQLTGLTGGSTFTVKVAVSTGGFNWSSSSGNVVNIDATILWTR